MNAEFRAKWRRRFWVECGVYLVLMIGASIVWGLYGTLIVWVLAGGYLLGHYVGWERGLSDRERILATVYGEDWQRVLGRAVAENEIDARREQAHLN